MFLSSLYHHKTIKTYQNFIATRFERPVYWNKDKTKSENKNTTNEYRYFRESNFVRVNKLFILVYSNQNNNARRFKALGYYLPKGITNTAQKSKFFINDVFS